MLGNIHIQLSPSLLQCWVSSSAAPACDNVGYYPAEPQLVIMLCIIQWSPSLLQCWGISEIIAMHVSWPGLVMCCTVFWSLVTCTALLSRMPGWPDVASCCVSIVCSLTFVKNILSQSILSITCHLPISGEFAIFLINMRPYYILYGNFEPIFWSFGFSLSICWVLKWN